jgi:hypothetical protein
LFKVNIVVKVLLLLLLLLGWPLHWLFLVFTIWWFGKKGKWDPM